MERFFGQFQQQQFQQQSKEYVSFKAGRCDVEDKGNNKFLVKPDRRKGQLMLIKHVDELTHLQWKDRTTNIVVEDIIVMPSDAMFTKIDTGRPKDRVYLLQYIGGSSRRFFFWMQSISDEKDEENAKKLNDSIANPPSDPEAAGAGGATEGASAGTTGPPQQNVEDLLASMLGGAQTGQAANATTAAARAAPAQQARPTGTGGQLTSADLQRAMMNISGMQAQQQAAPLTEVVNAEEVLRSGILADPAVQEQLIPLLAEGQQTPEQLEAIIRSPQLRSTLASLTGALQTDNFNAILSNFGLDASRGLEALTQGNNVEAFLQALLALQQQEGGEGEENKERETKDEGKSS